MTDNVLIVPGFRGSGAEHWQSWLEHELPGSRRVSDIDWELPVLEEWAAAIGAELDRLPHPVWIVAHSFGCLASVAATARHRDRVSGVVLVAPADPERFAVDGVLRAGDKQCISAATRLPQQRLGVGGLLIASRSDPWMRFESALQWATRWGLPVYDAGVVGHINVASGHGRWPLLLDLFAALRAAKPRAKPVTGGRGAVVSTRAAAGALQYC